MKKHTIVLMAALMAMSAYASTASAGVNNGEKLFKKYCVRCHGDDGSVSEYGKSLEPRSARDLRTTRLFISPGELRAIIKFGVYGREMPSWDSILSDTDIIDVAAYVRTLKYTPDIEAGKKFFEKACATCHLKDGVGKRLFHAPDLDMSPLGAIEMARVIRFGRHGTMMSPKRDMFENPDVANVVGYLQSIKK